MPSITITKKEKIGNITRIINEEYEIPSSILCPTDNHLIAYSSYHKAYECSCCSYRISGEDYVKQQLNKAKNKNNEREL